jgi:anti-anti-sigma factor
MAKLVPVKPAKAAGRRRTAGGARSRIAVEGDLTIYSAAADKQALLAALEAAAALEVDLSRVAEMDTAGLQLLVLLKREAARRGKSMRLVAHSAAALGVLDAYNLVGYFGDPVLIPGAA